MRHVSPKEMVLVAGDFSLSRVIFRRPALGSGTAVEMLAKNGEEIMISEQGTPDPVVFTSQAVMAFFRELGLLSGAHDEVVLDARHYRPDGFGFMQGRSEMAFGELRERAPAAGAPDGAAGEPEDGELRQSRFTTTIYTLNDAALPEEWTVEEIPAQGAGEPEGGAEPDAPVPKIGEKYLTTLNLVRLTIAAVVLELALILMVPAAWEIRKVLYFGAGSLAVFAASFWFLERRQPAHPSLRVRRYIWLCLIVFVLSMSLSYVMGGRLLG